MIQKNERRHYASDLSDSQWAVIAPLFAPAGNKSKWEKRELVDAVLYLVDNGCKWRNLPHDFPPYTTVANFYYAAIKSGPWENALWLGSTIPDVFLKTMKFLLVPLKLYALFPLFAPFLKDFRLLVQLLRSTPGPVGPGVDDLMRICHAFRDPISRCTRSGLSPADIRYIPPVVPQGYRHFQ